MNICLYCGKPTNSTKWYYACRCNFGHPDIFERMVEHLACVYDSDFVPQPDENGKGEAWILPPQLQPGLDMNRLVSYRNAVKAGFYNEG